MFSSPGSLSTKTILSYIFNNVGYVQLLIQITHPYKHYIIFKMKHFFIIIQLLTKMLNINIKYEKKVCLRKTVHSESNTLHGFCFVKLHLKHLLSKKR